jgi:Uma2 family endonuclease
MVVRASEIETNERGHPEFAGLRMSVDEFLELPDDGFKYELIDGVVVVSPRPRPWHQGVAIEVLAQLHQFLQTHPVGKAFMECDVHLGANAAGDDLVYAPDVVFVRAERVKAMAEKLFGPPDLVVEVISRGSRRMDPITKRGDYERYGVGEYWIFDPQRAAMTFLRLQGAAFTEITPGADSFASEAVSGFVLDLKPIREAFKPW